MTDTKLYLQNSVAFVVYASEQVECDV